jgi:multidrug efflux pump subunit AcrA (membrane-fusion protein)
MTGAALAVSILALCTSVIALCFLFPAEMRERQRVQREMDAQSRAQEAERREKLADQRAQAADERAQAADERAQAADERAQAADLRDQARARREEIAAQTTRIGRPTTELLGSEPGPGRAYRFRVTNIGHAAMRDLKPFLVDSSGAVVSPLPGMYLKVLQSREQEEFIMTVTTAVDRDPLFLRYEWGDDYGNQEHVSDVVIPDT